MRVINDYVAVETLKIVHCLLAASVHASATFNLIEEALLVGISRVVG